MKVKVEKIIETDAKYLYAYLGEYMYLEDLNFTYADVNNKVEAATKDDDLNAFLKEYPSLNAMRYNQDMKGICLKIDIDNGKVINWPKELYEVEFIDVKIVDSGEYVLTNEKGNEIITKEGYVPDCLQIESNGYGDYLEFVVDKNGFIKDWSFNQKDVDSFKEY